MTDRIIRFSETRNFQDCRRSWMNGYMLELTTPEFTGDHKPTKANTGTLVHADLEAYYKGDTDHPGAWLATQTPPQSDNFQKEWDGIYELSRIMLEGYAQWLTEEGMDQGERTLGTEVEIDVPFGEILGDKVTLRVHIDRLVFDETWDRYIVDDYKTVDSIGVGLEFTTNAQLLTYALAVQDVLGYPVAECRHTMLRRVKRTARANPPFYGRESLTPSVAAIESQRIQLTSTLTDIVRAYQELEAGGDHRFFAPAHPTRDCSWRCKFLPICAMHDDGSDLTGVRETLYIKRKDQ